MDKQNIKSKTKHFSKKKYTFGSNHKNSNQTEIVLFRKNSGQLIVKEQCSIDGFRKLNIKEQGSMCCLTYLFNIAVQKLKIFYRRYIEQYCCTRETQVIFKRDESGIKINQTPNVSKQRNYSSLDDKANGNMSEIEISSVSLKRNSQPNTWRMRSRRKSHKFTVEIFHEAVKIAGPEVVEMYTAYMNGIGDNSYNIGPEQRQLVYVVLFPEDCRLFLLIPTTRDSFIYSKEIIYLQEYQRFI